VLASASLDNPLPAAPALTAAGPAAL